MNKQRSISLLLVVLIPLLLIGCTPSRSSPSNPTTVEQFRKGTDGVVVTYAEGTPPSIIDVRAYSRGIPVTIKLENKGAADVKSGWVRLLRFHDFIGYTDTDTPFELKGKSDAFPEGDWTETSFKVDVLPDRLPMPETKATFYVQACYDYETKAEAVICIDPHPDEKTILEKPCQKQSPVSLSGGQGAPVAVSKVDYELIDTIEENQRGEELMDVLLRVYVSNVGKGLVSKKRSSCSLEPWDSTIEGDVSMVIDGRLQKLSCNAFGGEVGFKPSMVLSETTAENYFTCIAKVPRNKGIFKTPVLIDLQYNYLTQQMAKEVLIRA
ncbi:hypothetical protein HZB02_04845 [Candidatus Woesearchaeota archaeon]|nr:hypothetical protein [Candidatus Woesearchaeota archaeon]